MNQKNVKERYFRNGYKNRRNIEYIVEYKKEQYRKYDIEQKNVNLMNNNKKNKMR